MKKQIFMSLVVLLMIFNFGYSQMHKSYQIQPDNSAEEYIKQGNAYLTKGQYDEALIYYKKAIEIDPNNALAYNSICFIYNKQGQYDKAIEYCSKAIELAPNKALYYGARAAVYWSKGQYDLAIADLIKAIKIDPNNAPAHRYICLIYEEQGQYDKAIEYCSKAIELDPEDAIAYNGRGRAYLKKGQYDLAIVDFTKAIELNSKYDMAYYARAVAYILKDNLILAKTDLIKAIQLNPTYSESHYLLAFLYHKIGEKDLAKNHFQTAKKLKTKIIFQVTKCLDDKFISKKIKCFCAETLLTASLYLSVPKNIIAKAKKILSSTAYTSVLVTELETELPSLPAYGNIYALIVGVEQYDNEKVPSVKYALRDAILMRAMATHIMGVRSDKSHLFFLENPSLIEFRKSLAKALQKLASPRSRLIIYFAGHGAVDDEGNIYWAMRDTDPAFISETAFPIKSLLEKTKNMPGQVIVIADACYAGGGRSISEKEGKKRPMINVKIKKTIEKQKTPVSNFGFIFAAKGDEISLSLEKTGHGVLTYALYQALRNDALDKDENGWISLEEVKDYLIRKVKKLALSTGGTQNPVIIGSPNILLAQVE